MAHVCDTHTLETMNDHKKKSDTKEINSKEWKYKENMVCF